MTPANSGASETTGLTTKDLIEPFTLQSYAGQMFLVRSRPVPRETLCRLDYVEGTYRTKPCGLETPEDFRARALALTPKYLAVFGTRNGMPWVVCVQEDKNSTAHPLAISLIDLRSLSKGRRCYHTAVWWHDDIFFVRHGGYNMAILDIANQQITPLAIPTPLVSSPVIVRGNDGCIYMAVHDGKVLYVLCYTPGWEVPRCVAARPHPFCVKLGLFPLTKTVFLTTISSSAYSHAHFGLLDIQDGDWVDVDPAAFACKPVPRVSLHSAGRNIIVASTNPCKKVFALVAPSAFLAGSPLLRHQQGVPLGHALSCVFPGNPQWPRRDLPDAFHSPRLAVLTPLQSSEPGTARFTLSVYAPRNHWENSALPLPRAMRVLLEAQASRLPVSPRNESRHKQFLLRLLRFCDKYKSWLSSANDRRLRTLNAALDSLRKGAPEVRGLHCVHGVRKLREIARDDNGPYAPLPQELERTHMSGPITFPQHYVPLQVFFWNGGIAVYGVRTNVPSLPARCFTYGGKWPEELTWLSKKLSGNASGYVLTQCGPNTIVAVSRDLQKSFRVTPDRSMPIHVAPVFRQNGEDRKGSCYPLTLHSAGGLTLLAAEVGHAVLLYRLGQSVEDPLYAGKEGEAWIRVPALAGKNMDPELLDPGRLDPASTVVLQIGTRVVVYHRQQGTFSYLHVADHLSPNSFIFPALLPVMRYRDTIMEKIYPTIDSFDPMMIEDLALARSVGLGGRDLAMISAEPPVNWRPPKLHKLPRMVPADEVIGQDPRLRGKGYSWRRQPAAHTEPRFPKPAGATVGIYTVDVSDLENDAEASMAAKAFSVRRAGGRSLSPAFVQEPNPLYQIIKPDVYTSMGGLSAQRLECSCLIGSDLFGVLNVDGKLWLKRTMVGLDGRPDLELVAPLVDLYAAPCGQSKLAGYSDPLTKRQMLMLTLTIPFCEHALTKDAWDDGSGTQKTLGRAIRRWFSIDPVTMRIREIVLKGIPATRHTGLPVMDMLAFGKEGHKLLLNVQGPGGVYEVDVAAQTISPLDIGGLVGKDAIRLPGGDVVVTSTVCNSGGWKSQTTFHAIRDISKPERKVTTSTLQVDHRRVRRFVPIMALTDSVVLACFLNAYNHRGEVSMLDLGRGIASPIMEFPFLLEGNRVLGQVIGGRMLLASQNAAGGFCFLELRPKDLIACAPRGVWRSNATRHLHSAGICLPQNAYARSEVADEDAYLEPLL